MDASLPLVRRAAAESVAAFALVFAGCGAIVADARYDGVLGAVGDSLVFGLINMVMVYATGHLSGGAHQPGRASGVHTQPPLPRP
jgi:glycerol uptake facilitator-like aquaporin